jgi:hypothetical protein
VLVIRGLRVVLLYSCVGYGKSGAVPPGIIPVDPPPRDIIPRLEPKTPSGLASSAEVRIVAPTRNKRYPRGNKLACWVGLHLHIFTITGPGLDSRLPAPPGLDGFWCRNLRICVNYVWREGKPHDVLSRCVNYVWRREKDRRPRHTPQFFNLIQVGK